MPQAIGRARAVGYGSPMARASTVKWVAAALGMGALAFVGCVGDDPIPGGAADSGAPVADAIPTPPLTDASPPPADADAAPPVSPDAAPPANCPAGCLPPAPSGWTGPSVTYDGPDATKPTACPSPYTQLELEANQNTTAPAAVCDCGAASFTGAKCTANVELWGTTGCNIGATLLEGVASSAGACLTVTNGTRAGLLVSTPMLDRGTCTFPAPTKTLPPPTFDKTELACGLAQPAACTGRADCVASPTPPSPFTRVCIHKDGDQPCPSADFSKRFVAFKSLTDTRTCTACSGATAGGACGTAWGFTNTAAQCGVVVPPTTHQAGACVSNPGVGAHVNIGAMAPSGITCSPTGGTPTGTVVESEAVTFCCDR